MNMAQHPIQNPIQILPLPVTPWDFVPKTRTKKLEKKPHSFQVYRLACIRMMQFFNIPYTSVLISKLYSEENERVIDTCQIIANEAYNIMILDKTLPFK